MQVTEGDGYYLGRALINGQIAAGRVLTRTVRFTKWAIAGKNSPPSRLVPNFGTSSARLRLSVYAIFLLSDDRPLGIRALAMC